MVGLPSPFSVLKPIAGRALETALNQALALDADTRAALRSLDGQRIALTLASPPLALELRVDGEDQTASTTASVALPTLAPQTYALTWTAQGEDGHTMTGDISFMVH